MRLIMWMSAAGEIMVVNSTRHPAGCWAEEVAVPYRLFKERGYQVEVVTAGGRQPVLDRRSLNPDVLHAMRPPGSRADDRARAASWREVLRGAGELRDPTPVESLDRRALIDCDGLFICGGLACLADRTEATLLGRLLPEAAALEIPVAAIGYGLAATLAARDAEGNYLFSGRRLTVLGREEERRLPLHPRLPIDLEDELTAHGAEVARGPIPWDAWVVEDRGLVTGQNPYSANLLAERFLARLAASRARQVM